MTDRKPHLQTVDPRAAIAHALWESHVCIGQWTFCACLAMLRKAIDLWSAWYRDQHGTTSNKAGGEKDNIYWRLQKIADENKLYRDSIHAIINDLRLDATDAIHEPVVCAGGKPGSYDGTAIMAIREPFERLHSLVINLITTTMPGLTIVYSDRSKWRDKPPGIS